MSLEREVTGECTMTAEVAGARRWSDDRGMAATIVLFPLFAAVTFVFVQAWAWQHREEVAESAADKASAAVALYGADVGAAQADAQARVTSAGVEDVSVSISRSDTETVVEITGRAPGILMGTSRTIHARSVTPTEGFRSP